MKSVIHRIDDPVRAAGASPANDSCTEAGVFDSVTVEPFKMASP